MCVRAHTQTHTHSGVLEEKGFNSNNAMWAAVQPGLRITLRLASVEGFRVGSQGLDLASNCTHLGKSLNLRTSILSM